MKIAVVCANGNVGKLVVKEALDRGFEVTAFARGENRSSATHFVSKDALQITKEDLEGYDAVVDAAGGWTPETIPSIHQVAEHLISVLEGTSVRLLVVGGAGSLFVNKEHTVTLDMSPDFPDAWKPLSASHGVALKALRDSHDLDWTYLSPAADFVADGARTGTYTQAGEELTLNSNGVSTLSYADFAIAMVDEIEKGHHLRERISIVSK